MPVGAATKEDHPTATESTHRRNVEKYNKLLRDVGILCMENGMYERYMEKVGLSKFFCYQRSSTDSVTSGTRTRSKVFGHWSEQPGFSTTGNVVRLTAELKCSIAQQEQTEFRKDLKHLQEECETVLDELRASLEKLRVLHEELSRERKAFDKHVTVLLDDDRQSNVAGRAFVWFHENYMKRMDVCLQNMVMENKSLTKSRKKLLQQLNEGDSEHETPSAIDVSETKIRCKVALQELKRLHVQCLQIKGLSNRCTYFCNVEKKKLDEAEQDAQALSNQTRRRVKMNTRLIAIIEDHRDRFYKNTAHNRRRRNLLERTKIPTIQNLMEITKENDKVSKQLAIQNRKLRLAKIRLQRHAKLWERIRGRHSR